MKDKNEAAQKFMAGISRKLALLVGSSLALTPALPTNVNASTATPTSDPEHTQFSNSKSRPLAEKLILKQTRSGYRMIAQHDSHSSHSSHSSHASHSSHSSHTSHTSSAM